MNPIPYNKPFLTGKETQFIKEAVASGKISGNGGFTKRCHTFFKERFRFDNCLLTTSCTDALEMAAILAEIQPDDEVIMPSYTFVSTANAFVLRGARVVFADSYPDHPNMDHTKIEDLITPKTKAIVVVHYSGVACEMDSIMELADKHKLIVIEDAAHAIDSYYKGQPLGGIGHMSTFSFHESKNIISGEGGMLVVNDPRFVARAEIIWEKGTNRAAFFRGEIDKYTWIDIGSSFLPSEIVAAFLYAQLLNLDQIQAKRKAVWNRYIEVFTPLEQTGLVKVPHLPEHATNNGHIFYLICTNLETRTGLIEFLKERKIQSVFHYLALHDSQFYKSSEESPSLKNAESFSDRLVRLPLFYELSDDELDYICEAVNKYFLTSASS